MDIIPASHSGYPRVGDRDDLQLLRRTISKWEKGEKKEAERRAAEDRMTELALADQDEAGLDLLTDGQIRWYDPISHLAGKLAGVRINGLLRFFDTNCYFRQPVVHSKIERTQPLVVDDFRSAAAKSSRPLKPVLTGALTLARCSIEETRQPGGWEGMMEGYSAALAEEVAALAGAGAKLVQIEEPAILRRPEDFPHLERSLSTLAARKGSAQLALTVYFGDPAPLYEKFQKLPVDVLGLDFTYNPGLVDLIQSSGSTKRLALGLVDGRNTRLEDPAQAARQLEKMAPRLPEGTSYLTTSCGLEYLPRDRAQLKLKRLVSIRQAFLGKAA